MGHACRGDAGACGMQHARERMINKTQTNRKRRGAWLGEVKRRERDAVEGAAHASTKNRRRTFVRPTDSLLREPTHYSG